MKVKELKSVLENLPDNMDILIESDEPEERAIVDCLILKYD